MSDKPTGSTSNTKDCFRTFIGQVMKGYFSAGGDSYLIFDDGRALVFHHKTGAFWVASHEAVDRELSVVKARLQGDVDDLQNVLTLAGRS